MIYVQCLKVLFHLLSIYKKDPFEIHHCELLIPDEYLCIKEHQLVFRYCYVLITNENVRAPETVSVYNFAEWRIVKMSSSDLGLCY